MTKAESLEFLASLVHLFGAEVSTAPWRIVENLQEVIDASISEAGGPVDATATVHPSATIIDSFIGPGVHVYEGATVRQSLVLDGATIGHAGEVARSLIGLRAMLPRLNYVGSSLIGSDVQLGGATMAASHRHDWADVVVHWGEDRIPTSSRRLGAIVGDRSIVAYGCHLNPGCVIGNDTWVLPHCDVAGYVPPHSILRTRKTQTTISKRPIPAVNRGDDDADFLY